MRLKDDLALMLDVPPRDVRLVIRDVGGNFGTRGAIFPSCAGGLGRTPDRPPREMDVGPHEALLSDYQGRDLAVEAELALDVRRQFSRHARLQHRQSRAPTRGNYSMVQKGVEIMSSIYRMPAAHFRARAVMSNTAPTRPYRSAGVPR